MEIKIVISQNEAAEAMIAYAHSKGAKVPPKADVTLHYSPGDARESAYYYFEIRSN